MSNLELSLITTLQGQFIAAFASTNLGDVSPNLDGPKCIDTGLECDLYQSTCDGKTQNCIAAGPGLNPLKSLANFFLSTEH